MNAILIASIIIAQQQVIWIGDPVTNQTPLKVINVQATVFYDDNNKARLIIINPILDPAAPIPNFPGNKYGIAPLVFNATSKANKTTVSTLAKAYRQASDNINAKIAGVGDMPRAEAQDLLIAKTREALGNNLKAWMPTLDMISGHMKSIAPRLPTSKELAEYYVEIAVGLEAAANAQ
jgi:hypothetical protein